MLTHDILLCAGSPAGVKSPFETKIPEHIQRSLSSPQDAHPPIPRPKGSRRQRSSDGRCVHTPAHACPHVGPRQGLKHRHGRLTRSDRACKGVLRLLSCCLLILPCMQQKPWGAALCHLGASHTDFRVS